MININSNTVQKGIKYKFKNIFKNKKMTNHMFLNDFKFYVFFLNFSFENMNK